MTADQHLEMTFCTCWHSWRFGQRLQTAILRPQAEKVCRVRWEHARLVKAKASATHSKITCHDLEKAEGLKKAFTELLMGHRVVFGTVGMSAFHPYLLPTYNLPLFAFGNMSIFKTTPYFTTKEGERNHVVLLINNVQIPFLKVKLFS